MTENTLRDQFAMAALTGLLAGQNPDTAEDTAQYAYYVADCMIAYRQKPKASEGAEK